MTEPRPVTRVVAITGWAMQSHRGALTGAHQTRAARALASAARPTVAFDNRRLPA